MTDVVRDAIATELALLTPIAPTPTAPFGFGTDLSCAADIDPSFVEVDPFSTLALGQAIARRLDCPRGGLPDDADYGLDLRAYLNHGTAAQDIRTLASRIRAEITKDDRIDRATVTVTPSSTGSSLSIALQVTPVDPKLGGFSMTLAVTSAAVLIAELRK